MEQNDRFIGFTILLRMNYRFYFCYWLTSMSLILICINLKNIYIVNIEIIFAVVVLSIELIFRYLSYKK